jgi:hypothetical protein
MAAPLPDNPVNITLSWFGSRDSTIRAPAERLEILKNIEVTIANTRGPETLSALVEELGRSVVPQSVQNTCDAETIILAVPFPAHKDVAKRSNPRSPTASRARQASCDR